MIDKEKNDLRVKKFRKDTKKILKLLSRNNLVKIKIDFSNFTSFVSWDGNVYKITLDDSLNWIYSDNIKATLSESIIDILERKVILDLEAELKEIISESIEVKNEITQLNRLKSDIRNITNYEGNQNNS